MIKSRPAVRAQCCGRSSPLPCLDCPLKPGNIGLVMTFPPPPRRRSIASQVREKLEELQPLEACMFEVRYKSSVCKMLEHLRAGGRKYARMTWNGAVYVLRLE